MSWRRARVKDAIVDTQARYQTRWGGHDDGMYHVYDWTERKVLKRGSYASCEDYVADLVADAVLAAADAKVP